MHNLMISTVIIFIHLHSIKLYGLYVKQNNVSLT